jgi:hypothetical protein
MNNGQMTDTYSITNGYAGLFVCAVNNNSVLDVHFIPDPDGIYVPPDHGIEPNGALIAHHNITYNGCIGSYKTFISKDREHPFNGQDRSHIFYLWANLLRD